MLLCRERAGLFDETALRGCCEAEVHSVAAGLIVYIARGNGLADIPPHQYIISILLPLQSDN